MKVLSNQEGLSPSYSRKKLKKIAGVGINDADYKIANCPFYKKWHNMINRCYSNHTNRKAYIGCSVCEDWLTFSKFKAWMEAQDWQGKELDKDILQEGNKVYSPETCLFVTQEINKLVVSSISIKGKLPVGVSFEKGAFVATCSIKNKNVHLGRFENLEMAQQKWKEAKREEVFRLTPMESDKRLREILLKKFS